MNSLLPKSYQTDLMLALEQVVREFETLPVDVVKNFWNPQKCRVDLLPWLALMLGTTTWSQDLTTAQKRNICQNALIINRQKGTIGAIKRALKTLSLGASVVEWFEDAEERDPLTAKIILQENEIIYSEEQYKQIMALVDEVKRLSVHVTFVKQSALRTNQYVGIAMRITTRTTYHQRGPRSKEIKL